MTGPSVRRPGKGLPGFTPPSGAFRWLWIGQSGSRLGDAIISVALSFALFEIGASVTELGVVLAILAVSRLASVLIGGVVADRFDRRTVVIGSDLARGLSQGSVALLLVAGSAQTWHLAVAAAISGLAGGFFAPAMTGLIADTVPEPDRQRANAWLSLSRSGAGIAGPAIGGALLALLGPAAAFAFDAASFFVSAAASLRIPALAPATARRSSPAGLSGFGMVRSLPWLARSFVVFAIANVASATFLVAGPVIANTHYGGAAAWGLVLSAGGIGGVLGAAAAIRLAPARPLRLAFQIATIIPLQLLCLAAGLPLALVVVAGAASVAARTITNALWDTTIQTDVPREYVSRVSSYDWFVSLALTPVGLALAGPLTQVLGAESTLIVGALVSVMAYVAAVLNSAIRGPLSRDHAREAAL